MNYIDLLIILFIISYGVHGYFKGAIKTGIELVFFFLAIFLAFLSNNWMSDIIGRFFTLPPNLLKVISFFLIWAILEFLFSLIVQVFYPKIPEEIRKSVWNKYLGIIPSSIRGIFLAIVLLIFSLSLPISANIKDAVANSLIGKPLSSFGSEIERKISSLFGDAYQEAFTLLTIKPTSEDSIELGFSTQNFSIDKEVERQMLDMVNEERSKKGLVILSWDEDIAKVARAHSADMFKRGYFAHENLDGLSPFDRMEAGGISFMLAGENLALASSVEMAHKGLMESPAHKENILRPEFRKIGIGCQNGGIYGRMFTQNFTD